LEAPQNVELISDNMIPQADNENHLLTLFGEAKCVINCKACCDEKSDCQKRVKYLIDSSGSTWWCPGDEATICITLPKCEIEKIEIQWWGQSRSRQFTISVDNQEIINYEENAYPGFNGWTKFCNLDASGSNVRFELKKGVADCWGGEKQLGIRDIKIYGRVLEEKEKNNYKKLLASQLGDFVNDEEAFLMMQFLVEQMK